MGGQWQCLSTGCLRKQLSFASNMHDACTTGQLAQANAGLESDHVIILGMLNVGSFSLADLWEHTFCITGQTTFHARDYQVDHACELASWSET